ncbi:MAG: hypothetical protein N3H30_00745 [Candidatus Micrarchaeota archaeon]|nr:hypothetical protein [Candidatus Micrarchaeota archaeon]
MPGDLASKKARAEKATSRKPPIRGKLLDESRKLTHGTGESEMVVVGEIARAAPVEKKLTIEEDKPKARLELFLAYFFVWLGGLVLYLLAKDDTEAEWHGFHAIVLGVVCTLLGILTFGIVGTLFWLYIVYIGWQAAHGVKVEVPVLTKFTEENFEKFRATLRK